MTRLRLRCHTFIGDRCCNEQLVTPRPENRGGVRSGLFTLPPMSSSPTLAKRAWLMVALLWFVACLNYLDRMILITMRSSIKEAIPMTDAQFGLLTTIFLVSYGLLSPLGGFVADRISRSRIIIFSLFAWSATTWLTAHASTIGELLFYRAL